MAWEENSCICLNMQLIAILSRIGVKPVDDKELDTVISRFYEERDSEKAAVIKDDSIIKNGNDKLLFYTNTVDFRLVQIRDICVFSYDHDTRVWMAVAAGCDKPMRLKRNVNKDVLLGIDSSFIQVSQKYPNSG